jgi:flagellar biosynthesis protein
MKDDSIINPPDIAIALRYDGENSPQVTAKGRGELAQEIIDIATEHGIPLQGDPELAKLLSTIPVGDEIPKELYIAVAEVIAFSYMLSGKRPLGYPP